PDDVERDRLFEAEDDLCPGHRIICRPVGFLAAPDNICRGKSSIVATSVAGRNDRPARQVDRKRLLEHPPPLAKNRRVLVGNPSAAVRWNVKDKVASAPDGLVVDLQELMDRFDLVIL